MLTTMLTCLTNQLHVLIIILAANFWARDVTVQIVTPQYNLSDLQLPLSKYHSGIVIDVSKLSSAGISKAFVSSCTNGKCTNQDAFNLVAKKLNYDGIVTHLRKYESEWLELLIRLNFAILAQELTQPSWNFSQKVLRERIMLRITY